MTDTPDPASLASELRRAGPIEKAARTLRDAHAIPTAQGRDVARAVVRSLAESADAAALSFASGGPWMPDKHAPDAAIWLRSLEKRDEG